jgi:hypothetical protein
MMAIETALHGGKLTIAVRKGFEYKPKTQLPTLNSLLRQQMCAILRLTA